METSIITLKAGELEVELAPRIGGSVASFRRRGAHGVVDLMRPMADTARLKSDPAGASMFPMVPYANRIVGDRFDFKGRTLQFRKHNTGESSCIHGSGWHLEWTVHNADIQSAELRVGHHALNGLFSYSAFQRFHLSDNHLSVTMGVRNLNANLLPFGFGLHPFWTRQPDVTIRFRSTHFWLEGPDSISTERIATPPELDYSQAQPLPRTWRNNCYGGWDGFAEIVYPRSNAGLQIQAGPLFRHLMLYSDPSKTFFCLEPQTHATGAFNNIERNNEDDLGLFLLEPGQLAEETISFIRFAM